MKASDFFNKNADRFGAPTGHDKGTGWSESFFVDFIKYRSRPGSSVLDVGCGDGKFSEHLSMSAPYVKITAMDPSDELLKKIIDSKIERVRGELPDDIPTDRRFDFIHLTDVLHHVVGLSIDESGNMMAKSIKTLSGMLNPDGYLLIKDLFMESVVKPTLARSTLFRLLRLQNAIGVRFVPTSEAVLGLSVCFYTREELKRAIRGSGKLTIIHSKYDFKPVGLVERAAMISALGRMTFVCKGVRPQI